jgi:hypothetical protein
MNLPDRCVEWPFARDRYGYGAVRKGGVYVKAHRLFYELFIGAIPAGLSVMHSCHNRACINPAHLAVGTHQENMRQMFKFNRHAHGGRSPGAKLNDDAVRHIRASGDPLKALAAMFNVSDTLVSDVRRLRVWRHVR